MWSHSGSHHLGNYLRNSMDEANGAKVRDGFSPILLWNESNFCRVELV